MSFASLGLIDFPTLSHGVLRRLSSSASRLKFYFSLNSAKAPVFS